MSKVELTVPGINEFLVHLGSAGHVRFVFAELWVGQAVAVCL